MPLILISIFMVILGVVFIKIDAYSGLPELIGILLIVCGAVILLVSAGTMPITRMQSDVFIQQIKETKITYNNARKNGNAIESAAIQVDIAKLNRELVSQKYFNNHYFDLWFPDTIDQVESIK